MLLYCPYRLFSATQFCKDFRFQLSPLTHLTLISHLAFQLQCGQLHIIFA